MGVAMRSIGFAAACLLIMLVSVEAGAQGILLDTDRRDTLPQRPYGPDITSPYSTMDRTNSLFGTTRPSSPDPLDLDRMSGMKRNDDPPGMYRPMPGSSLRSCIGPLCQ